MFLGARGYLQGSLSYLNECGWEMNWSRGNQCISGYTKEENDTHFPQPPVIVYRPSGMGGASRVLTPSKTEGWGTTLV